jgi:hypothetical protein
MYEVISIVAGIALYFLATRQSATAADAILAATAVAALVGLVAGVLSSSRRPVVAAAAPWFWGLLLMAVGAALAWGAIAASASLISSAKAHDDDLVVEAVVSALDVALAIVVAKYGHITERIGAKWLTGLILQIRDGDRIDDFRQAAPSDDPRQLAYRAARDDTFSAVDGWGFRARRQRFQLVAAAGPRRPRSRRGRADAPPSSSPR